MKGTGTNLTQTTATLTEQTAAWERMRELLNDQERQIAADLLFDDVPSTLAEVPKKVSQVMKAIFLGQLPPVIEPAIREWFQLLMVAIHTQHAAQGTERHANRDIGAAIINVIEGARSPTIYLNQAPREEGELVMIESLEVRR